MWKLCVTFIPVMMVASFDVASLCTSVLVDLAVETCKEALSKDAIADRTPLDPFELCKLLELC